MQVEKTVAIIGAGIAGCATAHALATRGYRVNIYERNTQIASEASGNPSALLYPRLSGDQQASAFVLAAYLHSLSFYQALNLEPPLVNFSGLLQLGFNARERGRIEKVADWLPTEIARFVDASEASRLSGIACEQPALFFPQGAWLQPRAICKALTQHKKISVFTLKNVSNLLKNNDIFNLSIDDSSVEQADIIVIANAHQAEQLLPNTPLEMLKLRGQLTQLQASALSQQLAIPICSDGYLLPAINGLHTLGATFSFDTSANITVADHEENLHKLKAISEALYQSLKTNIGAGRVSFRAASLDHQPLVGQLLDTIALKTHRPRPTAAAHTLPWVKNLYVNIGHGSHGFCSAPLSAALLAAQISKEALPIPHAIAATLNPNRFLLKKLGLKKLARTVAADFIGDESV